jgi:hypothetical protein
MRHSLAGQSWAAAQRSLRPLPPSSHSSCTRPDARLSLFAASLLVHYTSTSLQLCSLSICIRMVGRSVPLTLSPLPRALLYAPLIVRFVTLMCSPAAAPSTLFLLSSVSFALYLLSTLVRLVSASRLACIRLRHRSHPTRTTSPPRRAPHRARHPRPARAHGLRLPYRHVLARAAVLRSSTRHARSVTSRALAASGPPPPALQRSSAPRTPIPICARIARRTALGHACAALTRSTGRRVWLYASHTALTCMTWHWLYRIHPVLYHTRTPAIIRLNLLSIKLLLWLYAQGLPVKATGSAGERLYTITIRSTENGRLNPVALGTEINLDRWVIQVSKVVHLADEIHLSQGVQWCRPVADVYRKYVPVFYDELSISRNPFGRARGRMLHMWPTCGCEIS